ncbi:hypothetical protein [Phenylobacterium montanum]|uniref:Uncharacterized protein n=1 Tax=Phenylobacterium montanum TaxID=2823693 RepID=A0A975FWL5_9CAUL|nr:hypothetical protein [Caulobacter sp. S6]QUD86153.1 hypothetical protein KCG34_13695 [Caulobacter sp. S6]
MPSKPLHLTSPIDNEARFEVQPPATRAPVAIALVGIVCAGLVGLYRGVESVREETGSATQAPTTGAIVGAQPAAALPKNPDWSTLSGPVVLPPPAPKAKKADQPADSGDEADSEDSQAAEVMSSGEEVAQPAAPVTTAPPVNPGPLSSAPPHGPHG